MNERTSSRQRRATAARIGFAGLVLAGSLATTGLAAPGPMHLEVEDASAGRHVLCLGVEPGEEFEVEFFHSYDKFPFREFYRVERVGQIVTARMVFRAVLNGQGYVYPGLRVREDGWAVIDGIEEANPRVEFLMGSPDFANHRIRVGGSTYALTRWIEPGSLVQVEAKAGSCP